MKRTFWFGMIWTLAAAVYVFGQVVDMLLIGASTFTHSIKFRTDAAIYNLVAFLIPGNRYIYFAIFINTLLVMAMLAMAWKFGFISHERLRFWRCLPDYVRTHPGGYLGIFGRIAVVFVVLLVGYFISPMGSCLLGIKPFLNWTFSFSRPWG